MKALGAIMVLGSLGALFLLFFTAKHQVTYHNQCNLQVFLYHSEIKSDSFEEFGFASQCNS